LIFKERAEKQVERPASRVEGLNTSWIIGLGYCEKASLFLRGGFGRDHGVWDPAECGAGGQKKLDETKRLRIFF
jgi:hypothetical protein